MAFKSYNTINGMIVGEISDAPGARPVDYLTDALGSVVTTIVGAGVQNTYRYAGYGQQVSKTGLGADPKFMWVGGFGYREGFYVRSRHYLDSSSSWTAVDTLWPVQPAYSYARSNPIVNIDPAGALPFLIGLAILVGFGAVGAGCGGGPCKHPCQTDPCGYAAGDTTTGRSSLFRSNEEGASICCCYKCYPCLNPAKTSGMDKELRECIALHEKLHCQMNKNCASTEYGRGQLVEGPGEECYFYLAEATCLKQKIRYKCGKKPKVPPASRDALKKWTKCAGMYLARLVGVCTDLESAHFCQDAGLGSKLSVCEDIDVWFYP